MHTLQNALTRFFHWWNNDDFCGKIHTLPPGRQAWSLFEPQPVLILIAGTAGGDTPTTRCDNILLTPHQTKISTMKVTQRAWTVLENCETRAIGLASGWKRNAEAGTVSCRNGAIVVDQLSLSATEIWLFPNGKVRSWWTGTTKSPFSTFVWNPLTFSSDGEPCLLLWNFLLVGFAILWAD